MREKRCARFRRQRRALSRLSRGAFREEAGRRRRADVRAGTPVASGRRYRGRLGSNAACSGQETPRVLLRSRPCASDSARGGIARWHDQAIGARRQRFAVRVELFGAVSSSRLDIVRTAAWMLREDSSRRRPRPRGDRRADIPTAMTVTNCKGYAGWAEVSPTRRRLVSRRERSTGFRAT